MAKHRGKVYLGYEEEIIGDKCQTKLNYTVNKIGGFPNWPPFENAQFPSKCQLCGLHRLLIVQCYAPLENSVYHRTLYVFACINPNCWIQSESWSCIRSQYQDTSNHSSTIVNMPSSEPQLNWCSGADEWDENDNGDSANGNFVNVDNAPSPNNGMFRARFLFRSPRRRLLLHQLINVKIKEKDLRFGAQGAGLRNSDEDEESNSLEVETVEQAFGNLQMFDAHNANMSPVQGAVGAVTGPAAAAELEGGEEPGLVSVDAPAAAADDLDALLHQTAELPQDIRSRLVCAPMQFVPKYIYVEQEWHQPAADDDRVTELLNKYMKDNDEACAGERGPDEEQYEESAPLHGDRLFHAFLSRLRENPRQILRYSLEEPPLLGAPLGAEPPAPPACPRCGSRLVCELQLLPEFAHALSLPPHSLSHLHFLSVFVFTCAQSCWQPGDTVVDETVIFQPEVV